MKWHIRWRRTKLPDVVSSRTVEHETLSLAKEIVDDLIKNCNIFYYNITNMEVTN